MTKQIFCPIFLSSEQKGAEMATTNTKLNKGVLIGCSAAAIAFMMLAGGLVYNAKKSKSDANQTKQELNDAANIIKINAARMDSLYNANRELGIENKIQADSIVVLNDSIDVLNDSLASSAKKLADCKNGKRAKNCGCKNGNKKAKPVVREQIIVRDTVLVQPVEAPAPVTPNGYKNIIIMEDSTTNSGDMIISMGAENEIHLKPGSNNSGKIIIGGQTAPVANPNVKASAGAYYYVVETRTKTR